MNDFLKLNSNTLAGLNQKVECDTIIELSKNDLSSVTAGMDEYIYKEITGDEVIKVEHQLKEFLSVVTAIEKDESTVESICFQLRANSDLLFSEYKSIHSSILESTNKKVWIMHGVMLNDKQPIRLMVSLFYFKGIRNVTSKLNESPEDCK